MNPKRNRRKRKHKGLVPGEGAYLCDSCGEEVVIPIDITQGATQEFVEDCPICCCPNLIHVEIDEGQEIRVWAERE